MPSRPTLQSTCLRQIQRANHSNVSLWCLFQFARGGGALGLIVLAGGATGGVALASQHTQHALCAGQFLRLHWPSTFTNCPQHVFRPGRSWFGAVRPPGAGRPPLSHLQPVHRGAGSRGA